MWERPPQQQIRYQQPNAEEPTMHTLLTADVAREVIADRLRDAEDRRRARSLRRGDDSAAEPRTRRRNTWLRRVRVAVAH